MVNLKNLLVLVTVLISGWMYYKLSMSKSKTQRQYMFFIKIFYLALSFLLAFTERDFITMGDFSFGGRTSVMILIILEIADSFVDKKKES
mgnify:CR=1 FL=1